MKDRVKRTDPASLMGIGPAAILLALGIGILTGCGERQMDSSEAKLGQLLIRLDRYPMHSDLAEYKRTLVVTDPAGDIKAYELPADSGGGELMTVCAIAHGDFLLVDRLDAYVLTSAGTFSTIPNAVAAEEMAGGGVTAVLRKDAVPPCVRTVGRFDRDARHRYSFQPAAPDDGA